MRMGMSLYALSSCLASADRSCNRCRRSRMSNSFFLSRFSRLLAFLSCDILICSWCSNELLAARRYLGLEPMAYEWSEVTGHLNVGMPTEFSRRGGFDTDTEFSLPGRFDAHAALSRCGRFDTAAAPVLKVSTLLRSFGNLRFFAGGLYDVVTTYYILASSLDLNIIFTLSL